MHKRLVCHLGESDPLPQQQALDGKLVAEQSKLDAEPADLAVGALDALVQIAVPVETGQQLLLAGAALVVVLQTYRRTPLAGRSPK